MSVHPDDLRPPECGTSMHFPYCIDGRCTGCLPPVDEPLVADVIVCKSTRYGAGCGDPIADHDGNAARDCCCCNWRHNDPGHARDCIHCHARRIKAELGGTATMGEIAPHMPEHLVAAFWEWAVDRYLRTELARADESDPVVKHDGAGQPVHVGDLSLGNRAERRRMAREARRRR